MGMKNAASSLNEPVAQLAESYVIRMNQVVAIWRISILLSDARHPSRRSIEKKFVTKYEHKMCRWLELGVP